MWLTSSAELEEVSFSIPGVYCHLWSQVAMISRDRFTEILKAHRQHYLYTQHGMLQVPLMTEELEERFGTQIMCSSVVSSFPGEHSEFVAIDLIFWTTIY